MQIGNVTSRLVFSKTSHRDEDGGFETNEKVATTNEQRQISCVESDATMRADSVKM